MQTSRRRKRLFLLGAATSTLAVILWATYVFTAIWLRVRCARELAEQAEPLPDVMLIDLGRASADESPEIQSVTSFVWSILRRHHGPLRRLESLQRPNLATVMRVLLRRDNDESPADGQVMLSGSFSPSGQVLATNTATATTVTLWNSQTGTSQTGNFSVSVNTGQTLARVVLWEPTIDFQCFSVTDSHGEKVLVVTRPPLQIDADGQSTGMVSMQDFDQDGSPDLIVDAAKAQASPPRELLLIDSAGRIFARRPCPGGSLVGKLAEPHGKADQLVFGKRTLVSEQDGKSSLCVAGPAVVCIVEDGELKAIRSIPAPTPPPKISQPETDSETQRNCPLIELVPSTNNTPP